MPLLPWDKPWPKSPNWSKSRPHLSPSRSVNGDDRFRLMRLLGRVRQLGINNVRGGGERMLLNLVRAYDVLNGVSHGLKVIRNEGSMTPPPKRFRAHHSGNARRTSLQQPVDASLELCGFHIIGVASKRFISPGSVLGIRSRASPAA